MRGMVLWGKVSVVDRFSHWNSDFLWLKYFAQYWLAPLKAEQKSFKLHQRAWGQHSYRKPTRAGVCSEAWLCLGSNTSPQWQEMCKYPRNSHLRGPFSSAQCKGTVNILFLQIHYYNNCLELLFNNVVLSCKTMQCGWWNQQAGLVLWRTWKSKLFRVHFIHPPNVPIYIDVRVKRNFSPFTFIHADLFSFLNLSNAFGCPQVQLERHLIPQRNFNRIMSFPPRRSMKPPLHSGWCHLFAKGLAVNVLTKTV